MTPIGAGGPHIFDASSPAALPIYIFSLASLSDEIGADAAFDVFDAPLREQWIRIPSEQRKLELLFGRFAVCHLLARRLGISPSEVRFRKNGFGKPEIERSDKQPPMHFNVSHCRGLLAVALCAQAPIGVDIEWETALSTDELMAMGEQHFHALESRRLLDLQPDRRLTEFLRIWTLKEAVLKALGLGISNALNKVVVAGPASHYQIDVSAIGRASPMDAWHWNGIVDGLHVAAASAASASSPRVIPLLTQPDGFARAQAMDSELQHCAGCRD